MGRSCSICSHPDAIAINESLVLAGDSNRRIATQYGLSEAAIRRHREHIPRLLIKAREAEEASRADDLVRQARALQGKTLQLLRDAEGEGDIRTVLTAIREARANVELMAKLRQTIDERPQVILIAPHVQQAIVAALRPYPEAGQAVADVLGQIEEAAP